jgi:hypothetical protein
LRQHLQRRWAEDEARRWSEDEDRRFLLGGEVEGHHWEKGRQANPAPHPSFQFNPGQQFNQVRGGGGGVMARGGRAVAEGDRMVDKGDDM